MHEKSRREIETLIAGGAFLEWWDDVGLARDRETSIAAKLEALDEEVAMHDQVASRLEHAAERLLIEVGALDAEAATRDADRIAAAAMVTSASATFEAAKQNVSETWSKSEGVGPGRAKQAATAEYRRAIDRKDAAWNSVEATTARLARLAIQVGELRVLAHRKKARAEKLLASARLVRASSRERVSDATRAANALEVARHATRKLLHDAAHRFDALVLSEYLYWRDSSNVNQLLCVPASAQVDRAQLFVIDAARGIQEIEQILSAPKPDLESSRLAAST